MLAKTLIVYLIFRANRPIGSFVPARYMRQLVENSDYRKYDDGLRMILDCTPELADTLERKLAAAPAITVPTITLEGDANGAPHPEPDSYAAKFLGKYEHRTISGGIGHNLPQEAPQAFAQAVVDVDERSA